MEEQTRVVNKATHWKAEPPDENMGDMTNAENKVNLGVHEWNARPPDGTNTMATADSELQKEKLPPSKVNNQTITDKLQQNLELLEKFNEKLQIKKDKLGLMKISENYSNRVRETKLYQEILRFMTMALKVEQKDCLLDQELQMAPRQLQEK